MDTHCAGDVSMGKTKDLGQRIEILSSDKYCHDISIGLYRKIVDSQPRYLVHTYSSHADAEDRVAFIRRGLVELVGLIEVADGRPWLKFPCDQEHLRGLKRAFRDICRLQPQETLRPRSLTVFDKKADGELVVESIGRGVYRIRSSVDTDAGVKRAQAVARGYVKLCEMQPADESTDSIQFACHTNHDELMGMLIVRAQNVRAALKDEESAAGRGVLAPPSQQ